MFLDSRRIWAGVGLIAEASDNRILMSFRDGDPTIRFPSHWSVPTGKVESQDFREDSIDTLEAALRRELQEEIFVKTDQCLRPYSPGALTLFCYRRFVFPGETIPSYQFAFKGRLDVPLERLEIKEGKNLSLFNRDEAAGLLVAPSYRDIINLYFSRNGH